MPYLEKNRFRIESRYTTTLISYVQRNLGFSIIADCYLESLPPGVVASSFDTGCEVESGFLVNPARPFSPPLRAMIALVREKYGCRPVPGVDIMAVYGDDLDIAGWNFLCDHRFSSFPD